MDFGNSPAQPQTAVFLLVLSNENLKLACLQDDDSPRATLGTCHVPPPPSYPALTLDFSFYIFLFPSELTQGSPSRPATFWFSVLFVPEGPETGEMDTHPSSPTKCSHTLARAHRRAALHCDLPALGRACPSADKERCWAWGK